MTTEIIANSDFPPSQNQTSRKARKFLGITLLVILVAVIHLPGLSGDFIFDDEPNILNNHAVQMHALDLDSLRAAASAYEGRFVGRPLATLSLGLDWHLWGNNATGFKITNLLLHLVTTLLILALAFKLLALPGAAGKHSPWPAWAALSLVALWAIHPIQISTVLYVVQRMEIMATMFMVLALLAYLHGRQLQIKGLSGGWVWLAGSGLLAAASFGAKEIGALFPVFALCLELAVLRFRSATERDSLMLKALYGMGFLAAIAAYFLIIVPEYTAEGRFARRTFTWDERLLTQLRVLPRYLGMIALPTPDRLTFYYDAYQPSTGWLSPATTLLGGLFLTAMLGLAVAIRRIAPLATLGILWFFAAHLITSNIIPLELVFEHRNYFALFAVLLAAAALLRLLLPADRIRLPAPAIMMVLVCGLGLIGWIRAATWGEPLNLAMNHVAVNPESERARLDLGEVYLDMSDGLANSAFFQFARGQFEQVAALDHTSPIAAQALILMNIQAGMAPNPHWEQSFLEKLSSRPVNGPYMASVDNLIRQRFTGADISDDLLVSAHEILLDRDGISPLLHARFGFLSLETMGADQLALVAFQRSVDLMGDDQDNISGLLNSLKQRGHEQLAAQLATHRD